MMLDNLKHMIYEGFPQVANHPRLLREDQIILRHEETAEGAIEFNGISLLHLFVQFKV